MLLTPSSGAFLKYLTICKKFLVSADEKRVREKYSRTDSIVGESNCRSPKVQGKSG